MAYHYVATKFRTHPLSHVGGGCIVITTLINGESYIYDKCHYPLQYIEELLARNKFVVRIYVDNEVVWDANDQVRKPRNLVPVEKFMKAA